MKTQTEIARRALALGTIGVRSQAEDLIANHPAHAEVAKEFAERVSKWASRLGVTAWLSPQERALHVKPIGSWTEAEIITSSWRSESLRALLWALGCYRVMPSYFEVIDADEAYSHIRVNNLDEFFSRIQLRPYEEIESEWEIVSYLHWRCTTERMRLSGSVAPAGDTYAAVVARSLRGRDEVFHDGVDILVDGIRFIDLSEDEKTAINSLCYERHLAFNWMTSDGHGEDSLEWDETRADT